MSSFNITCHSCTHSTKFAKAMNILLFIRHELFCIVSDEEISNYSTFPPRKVPEWYSSHPEIVAVGYGTQTQ